MNTKNKIAMKSLFFVSLTCLVACNTEKHFSTISSLIDRSFNDYPASGYGLVASRDRIFLEKGNYLHFINLENDTFFCLHEFNVSTGFVYTTIWNKENIVLIANEGKNQRKFLESSEYNDLKSNRYIVGWDTSALKEKGINSGSSGNIRLSRIIVKSKSPPHIESVSINLLPR